MISIVFIPPPGEQVKGYDRTVFSENQTCAIPQHFQKCMKVREEVFVKEQGVALEDEFDDEDARSYHWIALLHDLGGHEEPRLMGQAVSTPVGTIRLVPPPHVDSRTQKRTDKQPPATKMNEPYVKLGRLATLCSFRNHGIGKLLVNTALDWAATNHHLLCDCSRPEEGIDTSPCGVSQRWRGLILVHAQVYAENIYTRMGFERDGTMGTWIEDGLPHMGMWRRMALEPENLGTE